MGRACCGIIGNGRTAVLVNPDLALAWLCIPRFDGSPLFAGALDPRQGGRLALGLEVDRASLCLEPAGQQYAGRSAVLESRVAGPGWELSALDYMPWGGAGVVRRLALKSHGGAGRVRLLVSVEPVNSVAWKTGAWFADGRLWAETPGAVAVVTAETPMAPGCSPGSPYLPGWGVAGALDLGDVEAGGEVAIVLYLAYGLDAQAVGAALAALRGKTPEGEMAWWEQWFQNARGLPGRVPAAWETAYWRSLMVMKLLSHEPSGALLAAPTASFPAVRGGSDNWDYRFCWLRDGYYTAMTFDAAGLHAEAARFYDFARSVQGPDGHWELPLYTLDGGDPVEFMVPDLAGPEGEQPVRFGNAASHQLQLDNEGNVVHGLWFHYQTGGDREALRRHWPAVRRAAAWTAANWRRPESGIWETREYAAHWVHGKAMCYAGLMAASRIAKVLGHAREETSFRREAEAVRTDVLAGGWHAERDAFLRYHGPGTPPAPLDISVLALAFYGLVSPMDPRLVRTVQKMERQAAEGGLRLHGGICRWERAALPFYLATLWLARYYLMIGRTGACDDLIAACLESASDLLLMGEHFDGRDASQWGNFPQAFSHEELARLLLERAQGWSYCPGEL